MPTNLILQTIRKAPLLITNLPEAKAFDRAGMKIPESADISLQQKLGHIYEEAFAVMLNTSEQYQLLEKSLQLQRDIHTTLGELDFLFRDQSNGQLIHLELAVKFYLAVGNQLPGPDARDDYFQKLDRLRTHQLTLTKRQRKHLPKKYRDEKIISQHLILGCLFDHLDSTALAEADFLHPEARRGRWLHQSELASHYPDGEIKIIPKHLWPVPISKLNEVALSSFQNQPPLERCLLLKIEGETMPVFLVPDLYPLVHPEEK